MNIMVTLPIRVVNELNEHKSFWVRQRRAKRQHRTVGLALAQRLRRIELPLVVTMTRIAPRSFDSDGTVASMKHVRDAIAKLLCVDDGSEAIRWECAWRKGKPKEFAVEIRIEKILGPTRGPEGGQQ